MESKRVKWNLLNEDIWEEYSFYDDNLTGYDFEMDILEQKEDDDFLNLLSEINYVTTLSEIHEKEFSIDLKTKYLDYLNRVDNLNIFIMRYFKRMVLEADRYIVEIESIEKRYPNIKTQIAMKRFFSELKNIMVEKRYYELFYPSGNKIPGIVNDIHEILTHRTLIDDEKTIRVEQLIYNWIFNDKINNQQTQRNYVPEIFERQAKRRITYRFFNNNYFEIVQESILNVQIRENNTAIYDYAISVYDNDKFENIVYSIVTYINESIYQEQEDYFNIQSWQVHNSMNFKSLKVANKIFGEYNELFKPKEKGDEAKCFAFMKDDTSGKRYYAISGVLEIKDEKKKYKDLFRKLFEKGYLRIKIDESDANMCKKIRYHLSTDLNIYLTYFDYLENLKKGAKSNGRLFSCCERKLFTVLYKHSKFKMYVKKQPCYMCEDEYKWFFGNGTIKEHIKWGISGGKCSTNNIHEYDEILKLHSSF